MESLGYVACFVMGITLGLMGSGGSILTVPVLVYLFNFSPTIATGYSLFVVGTTALIGSAMYIRKKDVDFKIGLLFAIPSVLGVNMARGLVLPWVPDILITIYGFALTKELLIMCAFAALMIAASYSMIRKQREYKLIKTHPFVRMALIAIEGFIVGIVAGFVGAGGGFLIIPALVLLTGLPMRKAVGTSLAIIAVQSLISFYGDVARGAMVNWGLLLTVTAIASFGISAGASIAHKIKEKNLKTTFGWFVLIMGTTILIEQVYHLLRN